jgi:hypothetical protein
MSKEQQEQEQQNQQQPSNYNDLVSIIQDKQLELSLKATNQKEIKIGNKVYSKKALTSKQVRDIYILNQKFVNDKKEKNDPVTDFDNLINLRTKAADYYYGIPADVFDANFEELSPIIEGCVLRATSGMSPDIDFDEILQKYKTQSTNK